MMDIIYYVALSLDGYIATPGGEVDWLAPFESADEDYGYAAFYASVDALVLGSRTYEQVLTFGEWPYLGKPCYVLSRRNLKPTSAEVTLTSRSPSELLPELARRNLHRIWLVGGSRLAASFRADGLVTEYILSVIPVILGGGIPLFKPSGTMEILELVDSRTYPNGVVQLHYKKGGEVA